ncbi:MAG: ABC transporter ATP-binding protein, partial [Christensenella sp.]
IGATGSGKSSVIMLIPRLYNASSGVVTVDGVDVREYDIKELRSRIGYVPQKAVLFSGTIKGNIAYENEEMPMEQVERAASIAQADVFIKDKDKGYDDPIAQGGSNVSGGQKQRLAIARALAGEASIYIFDDSFSALDFKTDAALRKAIKENTKGATVIIVAQRINTIMDADNILVIDDGKIIGQGTHDELVKTCDVYAEIARTQMS